MITPSMTRDEIMKEIERDKKQILKRLGKMRDKIHHVSEYAFDTFVSSTNNTHTLYAVGSAGANNRLCITTSFITHAETKFNTKDYIVYRNAYKPFIIRYSSHSAKRIKERCKKVELYHDGLSSAEAICSLLLPNEKVPAVRANGPLRDSLKRYFDLREYDDSDNKKILAGNNVYLGCCSMGFLVMNVDEREIKVMTFLGDNIYDNNRNINEMIVCGAMYGSMYLGSGDGYSKAYNFVQELPADILESIQILPMGPYSKATVVKVNSHYGVCRMSCSSLFKDIML